jgi:hypothetical protein
MELLSLFCIVALRVTGVIFLVRAVYWSSTDVADNKPVFPVCNGLFRDTPQPVLTCSMS